MVVQSGFFVAALNKKSFAHSSTVRLLQKSLYTQKNDIYTPYGIPMKSTMSSFAVFDTSVKAVSILSVLQSFMKYLFRQISN